jgi:hypothetical protein
MLNSRVSRRRGKSSILFPLDSITKISTAKAVKSGCFPKVVPAGSLGSRGATLTRIAISAFCLLFLTLFTRCLWSQGTGPNQKACKVVGTKEIEINCRYVGERDTSEEVAHQKAHVAINKASFSFETKNENYMSVQLTFTNLDDTPIKDSRPLYLLIDDGSGDNVVSRELPNVDLRKLIPSKPISFSDRLLTPALRAGHYHMKLWIPSSDAAHKFDSSQNLLLQNGGLSDPTTRLNAIAEFTVGR